MISILLTILLIIGTAALNINNIIPKASAEESELATTGQCGEQLFWTFDKSTGLLTISGTGVMYGFKPGNSVFCNEKNINKVVIEKGAEEIGNALFYNCTNLTSIVIPDSIVSIGNYAFYGCSSLTSITIPDNVKNIGSYTFYSCSSLTNITIPDSVTNIGNNAFYGCSGLTSIYIPNSIKNIGNSAFEYCSSLTSLTIPDSVTDIGSSVFYGCSSLTSITIPDSVTGIGSYMFYGCSSLTNITIPDSVISISSYAFYGCSSLINITIPDSVKNIGSYVFSDCSSLTGIAIPDSVTGIGSNMFYGCISLTNITIPDSVKNISNYAFCGCIGLTEITLGKNIISIGKYSFDGANLSTIHGYAGTYAETYAKENGYCFVPLTSKVTLDCNDESGTIFEITVNSGCPIGDLYVPGQKGYSFAGWYLEADCGNSEITSDYIVNEDITIYAHWEKTSEEIPYITGISILTEPDKTDYFAGDYFDTSGLELTAHYSDGTNELIKKGFCCVPSKLNYTGEQKVSIIYAGCSTDFTVEVESIRTIVPFAGSQTQLDYKQKYIYNISAGLYNLDESIETIAGYTLSIQNKDKSIGTGTEVTVNSNNTEVDCYTVVLFGDVNGDGLYNGMDAMIVKCIATGMLSTDDVSEAVYMAADCNHDGVINDSDVELLEQAGVLLASVDQSKSKEELLKTSSAYNEYLNLIDRSTESEDNCSKDENVDLGFNNNLLEAITEFVKYFIGFIKSVFINVL